MSSYKNINLIRPVVANTKPKVRDATQSERFVAVLKSTLRNIGVENPTGKSAGELLWEIEDAHRKAKEDIIGAVQDLLSNWKALSDECGLYLTSAGGYDSGKLQCLDECIEELETVLESLKHR